MFELFWVPLTTSTSYLSTITDITAKQIHGIGKLVLYSMLIFLLILISVSLGLTAIVHSIWSDVGNNWFFLWGWLLKRYSGKTLAIYGTAIVHFILYWCLSGCLFYIDIFCPNLVQQYKIQKVFHPKYSDYIKCAKQVLLNQLFYCPPLLVIQHYIMEWRTGNLYTTLEAWPSFQKFIFHIFLILLIEEFFFYYLHRILHSPLLYKWIHKQHHEFTSPIGISALYAHPLEYILGKNICF